MSTEQKIEPIVLKANPEVNERAFSLFQPDVLLSAQYFGTTRRKKFLEPEKKVMLAVLEDAVWCFQTCVLTRDKKRKTLFTEAEEWIMEENSAWVFSFQNICEVLGLNSNYMREGLMRWKDKELTERPRAQVYHLRPKANRNRATAYRPSASKHRFLKAAGY